jgi:hypothetical protein
VDPFERRGDRSRFGFGQVPCEVRGDAVGVGGPGLPERRRPLRGEDGEGAPAVGRAGFAAEQPGRLQAVDQSGQAAPAEHHSVGQFVQPQPFPRCFRKGDQHVVPGERDATGGGEVALDGADGGGVGVEERTPGGEASFVRFGRGIHRLHGPTLPDGR